MLPYLDYSATQSPVSSIDRVQNIVAPISQAKCFFSIFYRYNNIVNIPTRYITQYHHLRASWLLPAMLCSWWQIIPFILCAFDKEHVSLRQVLPRTFNSGTDSRYYASLITIILKVSSPLSIDSYPAYYQNNLFTLLSSFSFT